MKISTILDEHGEVVAEAELAWPDRQEAVLVHPDGPSTGVLQSKGWTVVVRG